MKKLLLKGAVSAILIWLLLRHTDTDAVAEQVLDVGWRAFALATFLLAALSIPGTLRWQAVLRALGYGLGLAHGWRLVMIGLFFNQVLPSSVGGDAVRIWQVRRDGIDLRAALNGVIIDRLMALGILFLIMALSLPVLVEIITDPVARTALALLADAADQLDDGCLRQLVKRLANLARQAQPAQPQFFRGSQHGHTMARIAGGCNLQ